MASRKFMFLFILTLLFSCSKDVHIKVRNGQEKIVVEGHIETGLPPYVILTNSQPFFSSANISDLDRIFIHHALVIVSDGINIDTLQEFSSTLLPDTIIDLVSQSIGLDLATTKDTVGLELFIYLSIGNIIGEVGGRYTLAIETQGKHLSSITTILPATPIDSLWSVPHPSNDTLSTLYVRYPDPGGVNNYIRYFTATGAKPFYPPKFKSTLDDKSIFDVDGKTFDFPLEKGHGRYEKTDINTFTYFTKGDNVTVRWCAIDKAHYDFWSTAEFDRNGNGNPFSNPIIIKSNINGGLGIWGGYSPLYYSIKMK